MGRLRNVVLVIVCVLLVGCAGGILAVFVMGNGAWVTVRIPEPTWRWPPVLMVEWEAQLGWLLIGTFVAGLISLVGLVVVPTALRRAFQRRRDLRHIRALEQELADLRNLPIAAPAPFEDFVDDQIPTDAMEGDGDEARVLDEGARRGEV